MDSFRAIRCSETNFKLQHWSGFQAENGWKGAPNGDLRFVALSDINMHDWIARFFFSTRYREKNP